MTIENTLIGGRYRLGRKIGQGGFAQVFLAVDTVLERPVAVKILNPDLTEERDFLERFGREARAIATLDHPNILAIYDYGKLSDTAFIVMPYVEGGSLHEKLRRESRFPLAQVGYYLSQAAAALDYAHRRNLVHRDVKPQNMLLRSEDDRLLLTDFGISKILSSASAQSRTGIMGTLSYMAPEQLGGNVGIGTDIYALGCVLFQMLTGQLPYTGPTEQVIMGHMMSPIPSIIERSQGQLPPAIQGLIEKALAKKVEERYHSAGEMVQAFYSILNISSYSLPTTATPSTTQPQVNSTFNLSQAQAPTQPFNPPGGVSISPSIPANLTAATFNPAPGLEQEPFQTPSNPAQFAATQVAPQSGTSKPANSALPSGTFDPTQIAGQGLNFPGSSRTPAAPSAGNYDVTQIAPELQASSNSQPQLSPDSYNKGSTPNNSFEVTQLSGGAGRGDNPWADQIRKTEVLPPDNKPTPAVNTDSDKESGLTSTALRVKQSNILLGLLYGFVTVFSVGAGFALFNLLSGLDTAIYFSTGVFLGVVLSLVFEIRKTSARLPLIFAALFVLLLTVVFGMKLFFTAWQNIADVGKYHTSDTLPSLPMGLAVGVGLTMVLTRLTARIKRSPIPFKVNPFLKLGIALIIGLVAGGLIYSDIGKSAAALADQGASFSSIGKYKQASDKYAAALKLDPKNSYYHSYRAYALTVTANYAEAELEYKEAVRLQPDNDNNWYALGSVQYIAQKYTDAEASYIQAFKLDNYPSSYRYEDLGNVQLKLGKFSEAGATYEKAAAKNSNYSKSEDLLQAGSAYEKVGNYAQARKDYQQILDNKDGYSEDIKTAQQRLNAIQGK